MAADPDPVWCIQNCQPYDEPENAGYLTVFLSAVPAITNMSITAKTDIITLLFQVVMIEELIRSRKGEDGALGYATGAFLLSWTMKPTALLCFQCGCLAWGFLDNLGLWQQRWRMAGGWRSKRRISTENSAGGICDDTCSGGSHGHLGQNTSDHRNPGYLRLFFHRYPDGITLKYPFSVQTIPNAENP